MPEHWPYKNGSGAVELDWALDLRRTGPEDTEVVMMSMRVTGKMALIICLCCLCFSLRVQGQPLRKRSISEVQLMHNVREHKQVAERQDWLQVKLKNILSPSPNDSQKGQRGKHRTLISLQQHDRLT
ncbi:hypothetical protein AALO_G00273090 [Alosa alosa]|uniref:Parathyroid hormone n=1 Tax=Alosa alosa TaxID=278164 RepID=A0AAV6FMR3_9TELE|nr:parathyroid hormone-like [Alosa sapidissima]XP_048087951.1 parathyroid hormone 1b [Alosa alosa]KAG5264183.1 hypothetical protein AALO_G00273090 [Alosa alosa]